MPVKMIQEPPDPKHIRYTITGLTGAQLSRLYWAMSAKYSVCHKDDSELMQVLWSGPEDNE
jgi:hypothetical protein